MNQLQRLATKHRFLWLRVIMQALAEAEGKQLHGVEIKDHAAHIQRARRWLTTYTRSFYDVCSMAGLSCDQTKWFLEMNRRKYRVWR